MTNSHPPRPKVRERDPNSVVIKVSETGFTVTWVERGMLPMIHSCSSLEETVTQVRKVLESNFQAVDWEPSNVDPEALKTPGKDKKRTQKRG